MEKNVGPLIPLRESDDESDDDFQDALDFIQTNFGNVDDDVTIVDSEPTLSHDGATDDSLTEDRRRSDSKSIKSIEGRCSIRSDPEVEADSGPVLRFSPAAPLSPTSPASPINVQFPLMKSDTDLTTTPDVALNLLPSITSLQDEHNNNSDSFVSYQTANNSINQESFEETSSLLPENKPPPLPSSPKCDDAALATMIIKNLDTGAVTTLDKADELLKDADPLSKLFSKYPDYQIGGSDSDDSTIYDSISTINTNMEGVEPDNGGHTKVSRKNKIQKLAKKGFKAVKHKSTKIKDKMSKKENDSATECIVQTGDIIVYPNSNYKHLRTSDYEDKFQIYELQDLNRPHEGPIWIMKFNIGGKVLATAGADKKIKIWVLKSQWNHFVSKISDKSEEIPQRAETTSPTDYFEPVPFRVFEGHTSPILDLNWSKQCFLLSSGMDHTVRLWHIARQGPLCCFKHPDSVPAIAFHPLSDVYFLSGCLDGKVRLWHIPEKKMSSYYSLNERHNILITALSFDRCGRQVRAFVGTYDGLVTVLDVTNNNTLEYYTSFDIRGGRKTARKITNIAQRPNSYNSILITSNDSRVRLYDVENFQMTCKYKGLLNQSSQIKASFSHDGKFIISGDENKFIYFWETDTHYFNHQGKGPLKKQLRRDKNDCYYRFCAHEARVTCAMYAPEALVDTEGFVKEIFITTDAKGNIKVFLNHRFT